MRMCRQYSKENTHTLLSFGVILFHEILLRHHRRPERIFQQMKHAHVVCLDIILSQHDARVNEHFVSIKENSRVLLILGMRVT